MSTSYENKIAILAELWIDYRNDPEFEDFFEYNDLGLPIAYALHENIVVAAELSTRFIDETFDLLLEGLDVDKEVKYENLEHLLDEAGDDGLRQEEV